MDDTVRLVRALDVALERTLMGRVPELELSRMIQTFMTELKQPSDAPKKRGRKPKVAPDTSKVPVDPDGLIMMRPDEIRKLNSELGVIWFDALYQEMRDYALSQPAKWKKYSDHAAVMRNWARMKRARGFVEYPGCAQHKRGLYMEWVVNGWKRGQR